MKLRIDINDSICNILGDKRDSCGKDSKTIKKAVDLYYLSECNMKNIELINIFINLMPSQLNMVKLCIETLTQQEYDEGYWCPNIERKRNEE